MNVQSTTMIHYGSLMLPVRAIGIFHSRRTKHHGIHVPAFTCISKNSHGHNVHSIFSFGACNTQLLNTIHSY